MLTVGELKKILADLEVPDDTIVCVPYDSQKTWSIPIQANVILFSKAENSYGKENLLTFVTSPEYSSKDLTVKVLVGQNEWTTEIIKEKNWRKYEG